MTSPMNNPEEFPTAQRVDIRCDEFETAWSDDHRPTIEEFLDGVTGNERNQLIRELVALEIDLRVQLGETPKLEEYTPRFEEIKSELETLFINQRSQTQDDTLFMKEGGQADETVQIPRGGEFDSGLVGKESSQARSDSLTRQWIEEQDHLQEFGDYIIISEIARGGMGVVYKAYHRNLNRLVALKMISQGEFANQSEIQRFQLEAEAAAQLDHPGIVPIFDVGEQDGRHFFSMGLVEGGSLSSAVVSQNLTPKEVAVLVLKISEAMAYAHSKRVIHRDLKPGNVLLDKNNEPRITDFGLAKRIEDGSNLTVTGQILGTPSYMPPEQASGIASEIVETADIYSIGAILYALLCGRPPFQSPNPMTTLRQVLDEEPITPRQFNSKIPADLETICLKCLEKNRQQRYPSAEELAEELKRFIAGHPIQARPIGRIKRFGRWCQRNPLTTGLVALIMLSMVIGSGVSIYFGLLAQSRAAAARNGATTVMKTLDRVIYNIDKKLEPIPAARDIRVELLQQAIDDLEQLPREFLEQSDVDEDTATAMRNMGIVIQQLGKHKSTNSQSASYYFERSVEIFEDMLSTDPTNDNLRYELALSNEKLADYYLEKKSLSVAQKSLFRNEKLLRELVEAHPEEAKYRFALINAIGLMADSAALRGKFMDAIEIAEEQKTLGKELLKEFPDNVYIINQIVMALTVQGDGWFDQNQFNKAKPLYEELYQLRNNYYQQDPENLSYQVGFSLACERMGNLYIELQDFKQAHEYYQQEVDICTKTLLSDPKNELYENDLVIAYEKLYTALDSLGDAEGHKTATEKRKQDMIKVREARKIISQEPESTDKNVLKPSE
ncbi:MAG: serine/threonine protein kinase [Planctomycetaceae bacterium]|nr:serine/threonine protein kinase [Planctomycetaceae bacterium]